jgi:peptidyl-prolyl cis-trans isomerase SurA
MMRYLLLLTLALTFSVSLTAQEQGDVVDRIIAVVGNEIALLSDLENDLIQQQMRGIDPDGGSRCAALEALLFNNLLLHQAKVDSLQVTEAEIQGEIDNRLNYFVSMFGSVDAFEAEYGKSVAQWRSDFHDPIRDQLLIQQMQMQLESRVSATPKQVQEYYEGLDQDSIPLISEQVEYSQIIIEPSPTDQEIDRVRNLADSVRNLVMTGDLTFSIAALRYSDDPGSKYKRGCYENIQKGVFVPEFEQVAFATEVNDISPVFESPFGYHFLKVTEKRGEVFSACHVLFSPKTSDDAILIAEQKLDSLANAIRADSLTFSQAAIRYSTDDDTRNQGGKVSNFREGGLKHKVDELDRNVYLVLDKLKPGEVSEPVYLEGPNGTPFYAIFTLDERYAAHQGNLREDYLLFKQQAEQTMRAEALDKWVRKRLKDTYIKVFEDYADCPFDYPWLEDGL